MIKKFIETTNQNFDEVILKDLERIVQELDLQSICNENINTKFYYLSELYHNIEEHCNYLTQVKGNSDSYYHKELSALEAFITYLIELYKFPQSLNEVIYKAHPEYDVSPDAEDLEPPLYMPDPPEFDKEPTSDPAQEMDLDRDIGIDFEDF